MILEIAEVLIKPGMDTEFERGVASFLSTFERQPGFINLSVQKCVEEPLRYRMFLHWNTIEDHTERFRKSVSYQQWRHAVGHCFAETPRVDHSQCVLTSAPT